MVTQIISTVAHQHPIDPQRVREDHPSEHSHGHAHSHGLVDPSIVRSRAGVKAVSLSLGVLLATAVAQALLYVVSDSVALLTDVIHNGGDALTALPLGAAFLLRSRRAERLAGYAVVLVILASAMLAMLQLVERLIHPQTPTHLWALLIAGLIGVAGNEVAAVIRWRAGRRLNSPALVADGNHARVDGYVSGGIVLSAVFIAVGLPIADPLIGLGISLLIVKATWESWRTISAG